MRGNQKSSILNTVPGNVYQKDLNETYEQLVYWRKNIFFKEFIDEISTFLNL